MINGLNKEDTPQAKILGLYNYIFWSEKIMQMLTSGF
jgi:hypothetical protein